MIGLGAGVLQIVLLLWSFLLPLELPLKLLFISLLFFVAVSCVHHHEHLVFAVFTFFFMINMILIKKNKCRTFVYMYRVSFTAVDTAD